MFFVLFQFDGDNVWHRLKTNSLDDAKNLARALRSARVTSVEISKRISWDSYDEVRI